ncbi:hypothetical protein Q8791_31045 [Nocardiopsis sp. CT-R113]|uniref:Methyl-accepting transducer domain-containing protein n=1 Tax=Nocardiopsis codii TaxID=3065942 RepID=A0ABU7KJ92_9ACTN|nr:hypothetical protein [Nocardiopsis sp. CT-R113]MEE2041667.1 hypothetical protein [Nocardiopsis sp. CT-R113]
MNDGPLAVNFLNAIVPDNPLATPPPGTDQTTPNTNHNDNPANTNGVDRTAPEPQQQDTTAPLTVAPPLGQATPPPTGPQPPATAPNNPTADSNQRPTSSERDGAGRSPQSTGDTPTPDPSTDRPSDDVPTAAENAPPAPETATTGNTTERDNPGSPTDEQQADPDTARPHEQRTESQDGAPPPPPASEDGADHRDTTVRTESEQPTQPEDSGPPPADDGSGDQDAQRPDGRDEDTSRDGDRPRDNDGEQDGDRPRDSDGDRDGASPAVPVPPPLMTPPPGQVTPPPAPTAGQGNPSPQTTPNRITTAIRIGELASASIKDAISGYQHAQDLVNQTREAESQGRPDADDLRTRAHEAQREANEAYRTYDHLAQMQADLLRPDGPTTVMTVETTGGPSRDTGPVPLGGTSRDIPLGPLSTDPPVRPGDGLTGNTPTQPDRSTQEGTPPEGTPPEGAPPPRPLPPLTYDGGFIPDRSGTSYDLGYLTTSTVLGPHMLFAEHLPGFVNDVLTNTPGMPAPARQKIVDDVVDILTREGPRPFLREGGHTVSTTDNGQRWSADIDLRPDDGDFYHLGTKADSGGGDSKFLRLNDAGPGVDSSEGGSRGAGKTVGAKFTMSPFYVGNVSGSDAGPIAAFGGRGGMRVRGTSGSASTSSNAATGIELLGTPNLYVGDLHMRTSVTGPGLTAPRVQEGTTYNGLAMNLPGEVVPSDAPQHIVPDNGPTDANGNHPPVNRPFMGTSHPLEITRFTPVPPATDDGTSGNTTGTTGDNTTSGNGGTDRSGEGDTTATTGGGRPGKGTLGTWLADHFLGPRPGGDRGSGHTPSKKDLLNNGYRERMESTFDNDRVQQYLPQMSNSSAHIRVDIPGSPSRIMQMWSVSTEYNRKDFAPGLADFVHSNTTVKSDSSTVKQSTVAAGSIGGGFGIWLQLPNGKSIRLDVPFLEYSATFEKSTGTTLNTSGTSSHVVHAPSGHAAYDVKRDFYVHIGGEPGPHRFEGDTVEMLTIEDARLLNGEPPKVPTDGPAAPPRIPFPNLAVDHPTDLSGATVRGFDHAPPADNGGTTGTTGNNSGDSDTPTPPSPQRPFYDDLAYNVLSAISEKRPGMVIPDLARTGKDYAVRPSRMDPDGPMRSFRERWGLRRNADVARENSLKVIKALSESGLRSGASDLPGNGIPVRLKESAVIDPTMLLKDKGGRPDAVTVRVYGDFDRLVHKFDTTASGGGRFGGSAGITTTKGSSVNHSLGLNVGGSVRTDEGADARGVPRVLGNPSASLNTSLNTGKGSSQGLSHSSEETVLFGGDSDVWTSHTRFTARLFEHDDIGMARDDRPQREHGTPLLGDGMDAQTVLLTPKMPPMDSDSPNTVSDPAGTTRDGDTATTSDGRETRDTPGTTTDTRGESSTQTDTAGNTAPATTGGRQPLTPEQARDMIVRNFVPRTAPDGTTGEGQDQGGRWTVIRDGVAHTWGRLFGGEAQVVVPPPNTTAPPAGTTTTTGTGDNQAVVLIPSPPTGDTTNPTTGTGTGTGTGDNQAPPTGDTTASGGNQNRDGAPADRPQPTLNQTRARAIRRIGGTFEHVNTHFDTGSRGMRGLLEETYRTFSDPRSGLHDGFRRKLESYLSQSSGGGRQFENHLSAEELATSKSATTPSGSRIRQEMSGGFWSPHDIRATVATKVEIDTVTDFRPVDAQMRWNGGTEVTLSTKSSLTGSVGLKFGGSGGRNPNPHPTDDSLPNEAVRPIPLVGPSLTRTFFSRGTSHTESTAFTSSVLFIPNTTKAYAFRASGHLTQAIEFAKNWSIGPPLSWNTRFHGWTVPVQNLLSGYVHSRDAQQADLVMDRATLTDGSVDLSPQPNPKTPDTAHVRPGFENNGRQVQPADPEAAIQNLVNDLASNGLELTGGGRELLLQKLTTHLGQNPDSTVPVPIKVRALGPEPGPDSGPRPQRWSSPGKVYVNLTRDPSNTDVSYVGQSGYYIESHTWTATDANSQSRGTGTAVGADGVLLQPMPFARDGQGPEEQRDDRPLFGPPAGAVSSSTSDGRSSGQSQDDGRTVELHLNTPYAKVRADTTLTLTLELGEPKGGENGNPPRSTYTGTADSGRIETMYPFAYMTFDSPETTVTDGGTRGTGTDTLSPPPAPTITTSTTGTGSTDATGSTGTAPGDRNTPPAPEGDNTTGDRSRTDTTGNDRTPAPREDGGTTTQRPRAPIYASVADALRTWTDNAGPRPGTDTAITKPAMVQDGGQALRDKANVVIAQTLGWQPPAGTPEGGQPTRATADAARAYLADNYGQDPVYNEIDHALSDSAVKAVYPSASRNADGVQFTDISRTEWGAKVVPSNRGAKILDAMPGSQLSDSRTRPRTNSAGDSHGGSRGRGGEFRPSGLTTGGLPYDGHEGAYTGAAGVNASSSHGAESGSNQGVKGYQESDQLRQGPVYLVEYDATWAFGAGSKLKAPAAFHSNDPSLSSTPFYSRPTRWGVDDVTVRMAGWYAESDAIAMGFLTPDQAKDMAPVMDRINQARDEFSKAEAAYADTRAPLEDLAENYAANPADRSAESAYNAQADKYEQALSDFNDQIDSLVETVNNTRPTLGEAGQGTDSGTVPPGRTTSGDGNDGTTRAPATGNTTTATAGTSNTVDTSGTTTSTGGTPPQVTVTPPDTAPAPTGPRQDLSDRFRSELNLRAPESDTPVRDPEASDSDGIQEQNTNTVDARVQRASDAADTAVREARDAHDDANGLSTTLDRGNTDLRDGLRLLTGSDSAAPAPATGGRAPAPATGTAPVPGTDGTPAPGAVRQARNAQVAADTAYDSATAANTAIATTRNGASTTAPESNSDAFNSRVTTATTAADNADTAATSAQTTSGEHEDTVAGLMGELNATPPRYQELKTAVDGLSGQDRSAGGDQAARDARDRATSLISDLEGIAQRADTSRTEAETARTDAEKASKNAGTAKTTADGLAKRAEALGTWAEKLSNRASGNRDSADRAVEAAKNAANTAQRAADAAEDARTAADTATARANQVQAGAADVARDAAQAETDARAARTAADLAAQAAKNASRPSPGEQTTPNTTGTSNPSRGEGSSGTGPRGTTNTREDTARRNAEDARARAQQARQTAREAAEHAARAAEGARQLTQRADRLRDRADTTAQDAGTAATRAKEAQKVAETARGAAERIVQAADNAAADAHSAHQAAQEAAQKAQDAAERAATAAETAEEARDDAKTIADNSRKRAESVRKLLEKIPAVESVRTSSGGDGGDRSDGGNEGSSNNDRSGDRDASDTRRDTGGEGRGRGTDGNDGRSSRGDGRGGRNTHDIVAFHMTEGPVRPGTSSPQAASNRMSDAIRIGELASASIKDAISGYQHAQDLVSQTREAESQGRPDADDLRAQAYEAQRGANEAYRTYDRLAQMQADLLHPEGPTTVMAVLETTGGPSRDRGPVPLGGTSSDVPLGPLSSDSTATRGESPTDNRNTTEAEGSRDQNQRDRDGRGPNTRGGPDPQSSRSPFSSFMDRRRPGNPPTQPDRSTQEGAPPPPPPRPRPPLTYDGSFVPDRSGQSYDLGYLTTSTVLGPHMLFAEHLPGFVNDVLTSTPGMPGPARQGIVDSVVDILTTEGPRPFLREGGRTVSTTHNGQRWSADIDLRAEDGDFYHLDTKADSGGGDSKFLRLNDAGPGVNSSEGGSRGAGKTVGAKFTMSPFYVGDVSGNNAGPIASIGGRGGMKVRGTSGSASTSNNAATGIELLGTPNLYFGDLHMRASVTGPGLTAPRVQEGTAYNGLAMNLPGEAVSSSDAPQRIVPDNGPADANGHHQPVNRPGIGTGHPLEITRFSPVAPPPAPASGGGTGGNTTVNTTSDDGRTGRSGGGDRDDGTTVTTSGGGRPGKGTLGTWLADHLLGPRRGGDPGTGHAPSRQERRDNAYRERIESTFDNDRVQQYLPQMSNSSAHIRIVFPDDRVQTMRMWSVSTEYNRKDFAPGLADFVHSNTTVKSDSSTVKHSTVASGSIGGGFGIWLELPNGRSIRLDVPFLEYSATFEKSTGTTLNTSGTTSHVVHAPSGHAAYDVKRDFYVHIGGEPGPHRFEGDTVEMLTIEDARQLNGEPPKVPTTAGEQSAPPPLPFPNLAVDHPTNLSGATVLGFSHAPPAAPVDNGGTTGTAGTSNTTETTGTTNNGDSGTTNTTGTTGNNDGDTPAPRSPQHPFYDDLAYNVLSAISEKHPGMVIPDLARTGKDYAVRPSRMDPDGPMRSFRERWGLRRNADVARTNTLKVINALSESGLKSGARDLPGNGIPVRLKETAVIDLTTLGKDKGLRPDHVTLRVYGDFDRPVHKFDTTASGGGRFGGSAGITTTKGSSVNHSLSVNTGGGVRNDAAADARGVPGQLGNPLIGLLSSLGFSKEYVQSLSHSSEETVLFGGDSDVWTSNTRFTARLFEHDDIGMTRDGRPQREHGTPLLGKGVDTQAVFLTPKMPPMDSDSPATGANPTGTTGGRQRLTPEQARDVLVRGFLPQTTPGGTPANDRGGRWTVIQDGVVHAWGRLFGSGTESLTPPQNTTAPPTTTTTTNPTGTDNNQAVILTPPPAPGGTTTTTTGTTPQTAPPAGERSGDGAPANRPQQGPPTLDQTRARAIRRIGGTFEHVNTHFDTGSRGMRGLLEETYRTFSDPRSGLHDGFRRKLESFLSQSSGNGLRIENHLSAEALAGSKSATTPWGSRIRQEMSGGFWSPHDIRATIATKVETDAVTDFRPVDAQMRWGGSSETSLSTGTSLTGSVGLKFGGSGGRNPNPTASDGSLPNEAVRPIPLVGPSLTRTFFSRGTSHTQSTAFTSSVLFIPNDTKAYAFRASGHLTQAIEFLKNWSIGPPLTWQNLQHGWTAPVRDLLSGFVHSRDAQQEGLVMDRATPKRSGTGVDLSPQPNPKTPDHARVRPGFEDNGRQLEPADPGAAIQDLVNDLARNGLELTRGGRELLLQELTTHLGQNPDSTVPVPVEVRALGPEPGPDSGPRPQRWSSPAKVYVNLTRDPGNTDVSYVGQSGYYIESHTWKATDAHSQNKGTGTSASLDGVALVPPPYPQDDQGADGQPGDRALFTSPAGGVSSSTSDGRSSGQSQDDARTVELHLNTPHAKVVADTTLTLTLELGKPKGGENGNPPRSTYTGAADSGRVTTLYPFAYMTFDPPETTTTDGGTRGTGTDQPAPPAAPAITTSTDGTGSTGTAPADRNTLPAPEGDRTPAPPANNGTTRRPAAPVYATVSDALRTWTDNAGPRPGSGSSLSLPVRVENHGQALRDKANVVIAQTLGWQPPAGTPEGEQPTRATADAARAYLADAYGQDPVYNEIDHALSDKAIKALDPSASRNPTGVKLTKIGRTEWGAKVVPSNRGAKILDALPGSQLSDSRVQSRTNSAGDSHGGSRGRGGEFRPAGLSTDTEGIRYDGHEGIYTGAAGGNTSSSHGAERGSNQAVKGYQESDQLRQGPVYLVEHDATWAFAAGSKLRAPGAFHPNDPSLPRTPFHSRPTRWTVDHATIRTAKWYAESDAIAMGFLTPDQAKDMAPVMDRINRARDEFGKAEATYADTRAPLEGLAENYAANPADRSAESAYNAKAADYQRALADFNDQIDSLVETVNGARTTLGEAGQGTDSGTIPPKRPVSGEGNRGTTRVPATGNTGTTGGTTGTTTTVGPPAPAGALQVGTATTDGAPPQVTAPPPAPAPAGPRQELGDRVRSELNLGAPASETPVRETGASDTGGESSVNRAWDAVDTRVEHASDAADTAVREARDARDGANGLSATLDRGNTDLSNGLRLLTGSDSAAPAPGTGGRAPAPETGTDGTASPGAVRQARDAQEAADTAHDSATAADNDITAAQEEASTTRPEPDRKAFNARVTTATTAADNADTAATSAQTTAKKHEATVAGLTRELNATPPRYQELRTAVNGLTGQGRTAQDARDQANSLITDLEGIAQRADTAQKAAEKAQTDAEKASKNASTAKTTADTMATDATTLRTWAEALSATASGHRDSADRAVEAAKNAANAAQRAADAAKDARTAADAATTRARQVQAGAADVARDAAKAEADARSARTAADLAAQAAKNASRPSPGGQTTPNTTDISGGTTNPPVRTPGDTGTQTAPNTTGNSRGTTNTREDTAHRNTEDARARAQDARRTARETAEHAARAAEHAEQLAQRADRLRERADTTAHDAENAAARAEEARELAQDARDTADETVTAADKAAADARRAHQSAQEAATKATAADGIAKKAAETAEEAGDDAETIAENAREGVDHVRKLLEKITPAVEPGRTSSEGTKTESAPSREQPENENGETSEDGDDSDDGETSEDGDDSDDGNDSDDGDDSGDTPGNDRKKDDDKDGSRDKDGSGNSGDRSNRGGDRSGSDNGGRSDGRDGPDTRRDTGGEGKGRGTDGDGGRSSRGDGRGGRTTHDSGDPAQRDTDSDTEPVPDLDSGSDDSDDGMSLYDYPDTPVQEPRRSPFDEPRFTPLGDRDDHALDPKRPGYGSDFLSFLDPKSQDAPFGLLNSGFGDDNPLPSSLTDIVAYPMTEGPGQRGNTTADGENNQPPASVSTSPRSNDQPIADTSGSTGRGRDQQPGGRGDGPNDDRSRDVDENRSGDGPFRTDDGERPGGQRNPSSQAGSDSITTADTPAQPPTTPPHQDISELFSSALNPPPAAQAPRTRQSDQDRTDDPADNLDNDFYDPAPAEPTQLQAPADPDDPWNGNPPTRPDLSALIAADKKNDDQPSTTEDVIADLTYRYRVEDIGHHTPQDAQTQVFMAGHHRRRHDRRSEAAPSEQYTDTNDYDAAQTPGSAYPPGTQFSQYPTAPQYTQAPTTQQYSQDPTAAYDQQPASPEETAQDQDGRMETLILWNGTFAGIQDLVTATGSDVVGQEGLVEDGSDGTTTLMSFENGTQAVYKDTEDTTSARARADAEQLGSLVGRAIGANVPGVLRIGEFELFMHYMNGVSGFTHLDNPRSPLLNTRDGHVLGLLDLLIANGDRNPGNWLDQGNGNVAGIDHGKAWFKYEHTPEDPTDLDGLAYTNGMRPFYDFDANAWIANPLTQADIRFLRTRLDRLHDEFARLSRSDWFDEMMARLDMLAHNARGTTSLFPRSSR